MPDPSGRVHLVTNRHGQHRLITVSRPTITGERERCELRGVPVASQKTMDEPLAVFVAG